jgi:hypothetical protein
MNDKEGLKHVFTGTVIEANFIRSLLEENGIGALVRNTLGESLVAGWVSGAPDDSGLVYVAENHEEQAKSLIEEYQQNK